MEPVLIAIIITVPPTLTALVGWRRTAKVHGSVGDLNGRGDMQCQLGRIEDKVDDLAAWQESHVSRWHVGDGK